MAVAEGGGRILWHLWGGASLLGLAAGSFCSPCSAPLDAQMLSQKHQLGGAPGGPLAHTLTEAVIHCHLHS